MSTVGGQTSNVVIPKVLPTVEVGTTNTLIVARNTNRKALVLCNLSQKTVFLAFGEDAQMDAGLPLFKESRVIFGSNALMIEAVNGITDVGTAKVTCIEAT